MLPMKVGAYKVKQDNQNYQDNNGSNSWPQDDMNERTSLFFRCRGSYPDPGLHGKNNNTVLASN